MGTSTLHDVVWSGLVGLAVVSHRVRDALELMNASGVAFFDVELATATGRAVHGYSGLCITGKGGSAGWKGKELMYEGSFPFVTGVNIDPAAYDGSDVCVFDELFSMFVSARAARLLTSMSVTGVYLESSRKLKRFVSPDDVAR